MFFRSVNPKTVRKTKQTRFQPGLEPLELRWNPAGTELAGNITQGNLYGDQSVVMALPLAATKTSATQIQLIDTGNTGMAAKTINTFVPFPGYKGPLSLAVGDFLGNGKGYQQLIVSTLSSSTSPQVPGHVIVVDLFQTFVDNINSAKPSVGSFSNPVLIQSFLPFDPGFKGGASVAAGDFNGDGLDDLAVGAGPGGGPHVHVYSSGNPKTEIASFFAFDAKFRGGVSLAAGHFNGDGNGDLIVGAGKGGGSHVEVFSGTDITKMASKPIPIQSYWAFGNGKTNRIDTPVSVALVESIVTPEEGPVTGLSSSNQTALFTPTNNAPLINGTIAALNPLASKGLVSLFSLQTSGLTEKVTLFSNTTPTSMAPVGYMFDHIIKNYATPVVLVADSGDSTISLYPLSGKDGLNVGNPTVKSIPKIYSSSGSDSDYKLSAFPFGPSAVNSLKSAVTTNNSGTVLNVDPGTSGMLPCRQVAYQSPFTLQFTNTTDVFSDFATSPWKETTNQTQRNLDNWYDTILKDYGPDMDGPIASPNPSDPNKPFYSYPMPSSLTSSSTLAYLQERMVAAGLQLMNRGYAYQHHHMPAWFQIAPENQDLLAEISKYNYYSLTPPGMQTPGLDCSDFTNFITDLGLGFTIPTLISGQGKTDSNGITTWPVLNEHGINLQGNSNVYEFGINGNPILNKSSLDLFYNTDSSPNHENTYNMLDATLQTGDLLYYGGGDSTDGAVHVTMWVGSVANGPKFNGISVPLVMDSHGNGVQVGVDNNGNPAGVVAPSGPQLRPWFIPQDSTTGNQSIVPNSHNFYYFQNFSHVVRMNLGDLLPKTT